VKLNLLILFSIFSITTIAANYTRHEDVIIKNTESIGSNTVPNSKSILDIVSTTKGILPPRMTTVQRDAITSPPEALSVYNSTTHFLNYYNSSAWKEIVDTSSTQTLTGKSMSGASNTFTAIPAGTALTGQVPVANGGTGLASGTSGGILAFTAAGTIASSAALSANQLVIGGGAGVAPSSLAAGTSSQVLHGNAAGAPTFGAVALASEVSGTLPIANGGTNNAALAVTAGGVPYADGSKLVLLAPGTAGQVLKSGGGSAPTWGASGSGGLIGDRELISNTDIEVDASGYTAYADAAGTVPVDCTGGSPNSTVARSTTTPITGIGELLWTKSGSANRQGEGFSIPFTVGAADFGKVLQIDFDYLIRSGTFVAGTSTTDSDLTVYIYDVTNSTLIYPSTTRLYSNSSTIADHFRSNFQTSAAGTSYRLCVHQGTTVTANATVGLDNISVHPSRYVYGTPISDWVDDGTWAALITATTSAPTNVGAATFGVNKYLHRRVGANCEVSWQLSVTTVSTMTSGSGDYLIPIPSGCGSIDTAKTGTYTTVVGATARPLPTNSVGSGMFNQSANSFTCPGSLSVYDATHVRFNYLCTNTNFTNGSTGILSSGMGGLAGTAPTTYSFLASIPISGWSSSVQMSDSADTRAVFADAVSSASNSATTSAPVRFDTVLEDSHAGITTGASWKYTAPVAGKYLVSVQLNQQAVIANYYIYKNGSQYGGSNAASFIAEQGQTSSTTTQTGTRIISLSAGDYIDIRPSVNVTLSTTPLAFSIMRISGPSAIAASETISASYTDTAGSALGNTTFATYIYATKVHDTHNAYQSGTYTIPAAGKYRVVAQIQTTSITLSGTNSIQISINQNGTAKIIGQTGGSGAAIPVSASTSGVLNCVAGDTITIQTKDTAGATTANTTAGFNYFSIERVGL
jgi:hypothetical protein